MSAPTPTLPPPGLDMDDLAASDWLLDVAEHYTATDRMHVRAFAVRLAGRSRSGAEEVAKKHELAVAEVRAEISDLEDELDSLPRELQRALDRLAKLGCSS